MIPLAELDHEGGVPVLFSYENLYRHYLSCRRNKRHTLNALRFEARQELELLDLRDALVSRAYRPGPSVCFVTKRPKLREIFAADFRDRVVHHLLVDYLEAYWERVFIHDSYACRRGKGVHVAVDRLQRFIRQVTANGQRRAWYLQLDVRNYFMSIDKAILWHLLEPHIADPDARWLTELLVFHDCTEGHVYTGRPGELERVPPHKTLLQAPPGKGLPIGNLNSQFFANVYLNGLDQFVKHELKCRHYLRYCDDFVLLATDPEQLRDWRARIAVYLREVLALELNPRERLRPVADGVNFLGYIVRRDYRLVRRRVVNNLRARLSEYADLLVTDLPDRVVYRFDSADIGRLHATLASYLGHFKHADSARLWEAIRRRHDWLAVYFDWDASTRQLTRRDQVPKALTSARRQSRWFTAHFPDDLTFFQVGAYCECYDPKDALPELLGLRPLAENRRGARYGFPVRLEARYRERLLAAGHSILVVRQGESSWTGVRERLIQCRLTPGAMSSCKRSNAIRRDKERAPA